MKPVIINRRAVELKGRQIKGYADDVLRHSIKSDEHHIWLTREAYDELRKKYTPPPPMGEGPGTELKALLASIGIHSSPTCKCNAMARKMNEWGEASVDHIEEIVDVMEETAKKRSLPFLRTAGRILVRKAIKNWKKKATGK